jgi:hypothetical protein
VVAISRLLWVCTVLLLWWVVTHLGLTVGWLLRVAHLRLAVSGLLWVAHWLLWVTHWLLRVSHRLLHHGLLVPHRLLGIAIAHLWLDSHTEGGTCGVSHSHWLNVAHGLLLDYDRCLWLRVSGGHANSSSGNSNPHSVGSPMSAQVNRSTVLSLMLDLVPFIKTSVDAHGRKFDDS